MNAVGIDVSKGKSTVTIRRPGDEVVITPRDIRHTQSSISELISIIKGLDGETRVCMEHTGRYYEPVATWLQTNLRITLDTTDLALRCRYLCQRGQPGSNQGVWRGFNPRAEDG